MDVSNPDRFAALWRSLLPIGRDGRDGGYLRYSWDEAELACREWFVEARHEDLADLAVLLALSAQQDDPRSLYHTYGRTPSSRELSELLALFLRENDGRRYSHVPSSQ